MVEQNAVAGKHLVSLSVIDGYPICIEFCHGIGRARIERRLLALRHLLDEAEKFARRCLIETGLTGQAEQADGLQDAQRAQTVGIGGVFGRVEADAHMAHGRKVVYFVGLRFLNDSNQIGRVGQVAIVQKEAAVFGMGLLIEVVDAIGVEQRSAPLDAMNDIVFLKQEFGQISSVLAGDSRDQCYF